MTPPRFQCRIPNTSTLILDPRWAPFVTGEKLWLDRGCEHSTTELPSHLVISPTILHLKPTPVTLFSLFNTILLCPDLGNYIYNTLHKNGHNQFTFKFARLFYVEAAACLKFDMLGEWTMMFSPRVHCSVVHGENYYPS